MAVIVWKKDVTRKCLEGQWLGRKRVCKSNGLKVEGEKLL